MQEEKGKKKEKRLSILERYDTWEPQKQKDTRMAFMILSTFFWIMQFLTIFMKIPIVFIILFPTLNFSMFYIVRFKIPKNKRKTIFNLERIGALLSCCGVVHYFMRILERGIKKNVAPFALLLDLIILGGGLLYFFCCKREEQYERFIPEEREDEDLKYIKENGDVQLCINKVTEKPAIIPLKDRFLHMLIIGPTGCGKTSQILLPMIWQDIQNPEYGVTVIEPKGDLAEKVNAMAKKLKRKVVYFNPLSVDCPAFNPLDGPEDIVIENIVTAFLMFDPDSKQFFKDMLETVLRKSLTVLKRLEEAYKKEDGTSERPALFIGLETLMTNPNGEGRKMVLNFSRISTSASKKKENEDIVAWFLNEYYNEKSKTYEHCSSARNIVNKMISNSNLRRVLNPKDGINRLDFSKILEEGSILAITTAQSELRQLGSTLGYFLILNLQSAVFKRPGDEDTRKAHFLYIDEFQKYSNPGFADMLTQGRSYRVATHLATQARAQMAMGSGLDGKAFVELVSTNARNVVLFPGISSEDAEYYQKEFGEVINKLTQETRSTKVYNPLRGFNEKLGFATKSVRITDQREARYYASDLIYQKFGIVAYRIISKNSVQVPALGKVQYIEDELNEQIKNYVARYREWQEGRRKQYEKACINDEKVSQQPKVSKEAVNQEKQNKTQVEENDNSFLEEESDDF